VVFFFFVLLVLLPLMAVGSDYSSHIASLIDRSKLSTLGERAANPRIQKAVYWLETARQNGEKPSAVLDSAVKQAGYTNKLAAKMTKAALLRNLEIAGKLGCLDEKGMAEMRKGNAAPVRRGPYDGQELTVDHILPRAVCPELDYCVANLELLPARSGSHPKKLWTGIRRRALFR
jgi:hypothetical protein